MAIYQQLKKNIQFSAEKKGDLQRGIKDGLAFFNKFNESRLELAFSSFSEDMKKALFEVIYFLHVNDPKYKDHSYTSTKLEKIEGVLKEVEYEVPISLYVEGSIAGVVGIDSLSKQFKGLFENFIKTELDATIQPSGGFSPIYSIASLGSIGTVGHKTTASDLDLQVQYELFPFLLNESQLSDEKLIQSGNNLIKLFSKKFSKQKGFSSQDLKKDEVRKLCLKAGHQNFIKRFPICYEVLIKKNRDRLKSALGDSMEKQKFADEIVAMTKLASKFLFKQEIDQREGLLKQRINQIQKYVQGKYPEAEVYLFAYSNDDYRDGKHGTTTESKEASGSAYELILNYEVLMPGIQFTPVVPIHFLMPSKVNADRATYEQIVGCIRYHFIDLYDAQRKNLVDLGATPPLTIEYMTAHTGAIFWEAFKASSGNLPKAFLNLLRIEMLFDSKFNTSIIELIKSPRKLDKYAGAADFDEEDDHDDEEDFFEGFGEAVEEESEDDGLIIGEDVSHEGLPTFELLNIEDRFPKLLQDPWWLRYKALKIAFCSESSIIDDEEQKNLISKTIDLCFALHIRVSDVFTKPGEKKNFATHREKVMVEYLKKAFPPSRRNMLEHIIIGEVQAVLTFEKNLKLLFRHSMRRILQIVEKQPGKDQSNRDEFQIWFHFYQKNFDPPKNVVRQDILSHLKVPRGRLQLGYENKKWFFKSLQKSASSQSRLDSFGRLDHLPDEVDLFTHESFLHGIAHCVMNGYYGIFNKGTLKEYRTHVEFSVAHMKLDKMSADKWAYIRPDSVNRLVDLILKAFPPQNYDYRDCIYKEREVTNILFCLNLLEYGRLTVLYRDNMKVWYEEMFDHPEIEQKASEFHQSVELLLMEPAIRQTIKQFFEDQKFKVTSESKNSVYFWINPTSVSTHHSSDKFGEKEKDLSRQFKNAIFN
ncbi:MAG: hypothetical protein OEY59_07440 [Deltaproteobacteria bacterium]|nr:hypothetical protein [Deltaproteobacteria bacterium]